MFPIKKSPHGNRLHLIRTTRHLQSVPKNSAPRNPKNTTLWRVLPRAKPWLYPAGRATPAARERTGQPLRQGRERSGEGGADRQSAGTEYRYQGEADRAFHEGAGGSVAGAEAQALPRGQSGAKEALARSAAFVAEQPFQSQTVG